jgi:protein gp37
VNRTKIEWCDYTWNPITGCLHACPYCYARWLYARFGWNFTPAFHPERLDKPARVRKPSRIFVGSVSDVFGAWVPSSWIEQVFDTVEKCPQHTFMFLTKNPERCQDFDWPPNAWAGASAGRPVNMDRARSLQGCLASKRYLSAEPLLAPVRLTICDWPFPPDWLIIGAQTGPGAVPPRLEWICDLVTDARDLGIPIYAKSNLQWPTMELGPRPREFLTVEREE